MRNHRDPRAISAPAAIRPLSLVLAAGAALSASLLTQQAKAQWVWTGGAAGAQNFSDATKWLGGTAPGFGDFTGTTTFTFSPGATAAATTATNNVSGGTMFPVNGFTFNDMSVSSGFTLAGTSGNTFQMGGASPTITLQGCGTSTFGSTGASLQLLTDTTIVGSGMGGLNLQSVISGSANLIIRDTRPTPFAAPVTFSNANPNFTGRIILDGGIMANSTIGSAFGPKGNTVEVTGNGGTLSLSGNTAAPTFSTLQLDAGGTLRVIGTSAGALPFLNNYNNTTGAADFNLKLAGSGNLLFQSANTAGFTIESDSSAYTGVVTIDRSDLPVVTGVTGGIQLRSGTVSGSPVTVRPSETGNLLGVSTFNIRNGGQLTLSNAASGVSEGLDRVNDNATINLASGQFNLFGCVNGTLGPGSTGATGTPVVDTTETAGAVNIAGNSWIQVQPGFAFTGANAQNSSVLTIASLNRVDRGTVLVRGLNLGKGSGATSTAAGPNAGNLVITAAPTADLVGGGTAWSAASTDKTISILPYAVGGTTNTDAGSTFVTLSGNTVQPLTTAQYATTLGGSTDNVRLTAATANSGSMTLNSLVLASNGTTSDGSVTGSGTLNVTSGAILATTTNAASTISNNINFGAAEGQVIVNNAGLTISGNMTGSNGLTKSCGGSTSAANTLFLTGDNSGLTGQLTLNGGPIDFNSANALPGSGQIVTNGGGAGTTGLSTGLNYSGATPYALNRDVAANTGWVQFKTVNTGSTLTINGQITGTAGVVLSTHVSGTTGFGDADIWLANPNNSYTGPTRIAGGITHIYTDGNLGNGGAVSIDGMLRLEGDWTTSRSINTSTGYIDTNGHTATLNGPIISYNSSGGISTTNTLQKMGAGTLNITSNASQLGGQVLVYGGNLLVNGTIPGSTTNAVTTYGNTVLGGAGTIWRPINIGTTATFAGVAVPGAGTLAPGNSGAGILTEYGNLTFANLSTLSTSSNFAVDLNGALAGSGYDQMAVNAASAAVSSTVTLNSANLEISLGYFPSASDTFFILTNSGTNAISGTFNGLAEGSTVTLGNWYGTPVTATISYLGDASTGSISGGNDVVLYNIVPAPGTAALLGLGGLLAFRRRR